MKRLLLSLCVAGFALSAVRAQVPPPSGGIKITFGDGRTQVASAIRRSQNTLLATIALAAGVRGETGYAISSVKSIEMPEPPALKVSRDFLNAGKAAEALAAINGAVAAQNDLRAIPGNWWAPAALIKVDALLALGRDREADPLIARLATDAKDPEQMQSARLSQALVWVRTDRSAQAIPVFDDVIAKSKAPANLARAWLGRGQALLAGKDYDGALLAYLRIPIFYSDETPALPAALLGSARSYEGLREYARAEDALAELTKNYPASPEAGEAKAIDARLEKKLNPGASPSAAN